VTRKSQSPVADFLKVNAPESPADVLLREENARLRKRLFARTGVADLIAEQVRELYADVKPIKLPPPPKQTARVKDEEVAVLHVSDLQIGKVTPTYDVEIAKGRLLELARRTCACIDAHRAHAKVTDLRVYLGGDLVEGESIFAGQAFEISEGVGLQAMKSTPDGLEAMLLILAQHVDRLHVLSVSGNHGRSAPRSIGSAPQSNWDHVSAVILRERMRHVDTARITWDIPDNWYATDDVLGWTNLITHGDLIRGGFAGFPFYGVGKKMAGWSDSIPKHWDNLLFGHFHQMASGRVNTRAYYANGTLESDNSFARAELAACGIPMQRLLFMNERHGVIADRPIYLSYGLESGKKAVRKK